MAKNKESKPVGQESPVNEAVPADENKPMMASEEEVQAQETPNAVEGNTYSEAEASETPTPPAAPPVDAAQEPQKNCTGGCKETQPTHEYAAQALKDIKSMLDEVRDLMTCETCPFASPVQGTGKIECRIQAPDATFTARVFPHVKPAEWCGSHPVFRMVVRG